MGKKTSVKTSDFRKVLIFLGLTLQRTKGSHESWAKKGMTRPVIIQTSKKEIPIHILKSNLKTLDLSEDDFFEILDKM